MYWLRLRSERCDVKFRVRLVLVAMLAHVGAHGPAAAESSEVTDAFSRLDALAEELAEARRALGVSAGAPLSTAAQPGLAGPGEAAAQTAATGATRPDGEADVRSDGPDGESAACGSRSDLSTTIGALQDRYEEHGRAIIAVNDELPRLRKTVLDMERVCSERLATHIDSALSGIEALDLAADYRVVERLTACVDRLREETDEELSRTASNIRMQRLAVEMERLGGMTHRVADLERALLRGISKRMRVAQELGQFQQEIEAVCR